MLDWLLDQEGLAIVRHAYARQMLGIAGVRNDRLECNGMGATRLVLEYYCP